MKLGAIQVRAHLASDHHPLTMSGLYNMLSSPPSTRLKNQHLKSCLISNFDFSFLCVSRGVGGMRSTKCYSLGLILHGTHVYITNHNLIFLEMRIHCHIDGRKSQAHWHVELWLHRDKPQMLGVDPANHENSKAPYSVFSIFRRFHLMRCGKPAA